ncbi:hypothetical protein J6590_002660 [Homalodisca vitripennis]|nr:hypothetical protein J6590_002660 [Homalodisca vitripennis]
MPARWCRLVDHAAAGLCIMPLLACVSCRCRLVYNAVAGLCIMPLQDCGLRRYVDHSAADLWTSPLQTLESRHYKACGSCRCRLGDLVTTRLVDLATEGLWSRRKLVNHFAAGLWMTL